MKHFLLFLLVFAAAVCFACTKNQPQANTAQVSNETTSNADSSSPAASSPLSTESTRAQTDTQTTDTTEETSQITEESKPQFTVVARQYFGTVAKASVNDNNVNIRVQPSTSAEKIGKVNKGDIVTIKGFSTQRETIDGFDGYWLKIELAERIKGYYTGSLDNFGSFGWIFSKYVDIDPAINVSTFTVTNTEKDNRFTLRIDRSNGEKIEKDIYAYDYKNRESVSFTWSDDIKGFWFSDPVGTFAFYPATNEIKHLTYMGSEAKSPGGYVTDDGKYFIQDFGTAPGTHGVGVYETATNKEVFLGTHYGGVSYADDCISIVEQASWYNVSNGRISDDAIARAEAYKNTFTKEELQDKEVVVCYRLNLVTKERTFEECILITMQ